MKRLFIFGVICLAAVIADTTPADDESSEVTYENKPLIYFNTTIGSTHEVTIAEYNLLESERCTLETSYGTFDLRDLDITGVEVLSQPGVACGLKITVFNDEVIGDWILVFRGNMYGINIEKRQPFTIHVEEIVEASVNQVTIVEGNDFYFRLKKATEKYNSCKPVGPNDLDYDVHEDTRYTEYCGYILKNVSTADSGTWEIVYGDTIVYRALIELTVTDSQTGAQIENLVWVKDKPVEAIIGPEDTIYCRIESPDGQTVFDSFGRCNISLNRASVDHSGIWKMSVGLPGRVLATDSEFNVEIVEGDLKPVVNSSVVSEEPIVTLSCSVSSTQPITACKFKQPSGRVLLATEGIGESRFNYHGSSVSYESGIHDHVCGIQITNPIQQDLGIWRCALESEDMTYYGFLTVLPPWLLQDPEDVAEIVIDPVLTADRKTVSTMEGDSITMGCSVQEAIRYCYFRFRNGSTYNVGPDLSHDMSTYAGAGFDAGECRIRFPVLAASDTGPWTCHVGFPDEDKPEQNVHIDVNVNEYITAVQTVLSDRLLVQAQDFEHRELEYCRFVRSDGLGFTGGIFNMPNRYTTVQNLSTGRCGFVVEQPTMLEHQSWIIVAKVKGQRFERSVITEDTLDRVTGNIVRIPFGWILIVALSLSIVLIVMISPKKNRDWTYSKANAVRNSFRNNFKKNSTVQLNNPNTATAA